MTARVEITQNTASPALKRLLGKLRGDDQEMMFAQMGEYMMGSTRERAAREESPDGSRWRPLSPGYAKWKAKKRPGVPMAKFDFHMLGDQFAYQVDAQGLLLGTNAPYGAIYQFGGTTHHAAHSRKLAFGKDRANGMKTFAKAGSKDVDHEKWATVDAYDVTLPARPWLGVSNADEEELQAIAIDHLGEAFESD
ncbi:MAG: phage virion morphogenesis protein [Stenotrophomonas sp.]